MEEKKLPKKEIQAEAPVMAEEEIQEKREWYAQTFPHMSPEQIEANIQVNIEYKKRQKQEEEERLKRMIERTKNPKMASNEELIAFLTHGWDEPDDSDEPDLCLVQYE